MSVLHTTVPYLWRRGFLVTRTVLALAVLSIYLLQPLEWSLATAGFLAAYAGFAVFTLYRHLSAEAQSWPAAYLFADLALFLIATLHPSECGVGLGLATWCYAMLLGSMLYRAVFVCVAVLVGVGVAFVPGAENFDRIWLPVSISGLLAAVLAVHKDHVHQHLSAALKRSLLSRSEAEVAREHERQRIAADFHDGPLQSFIGFQMRLELIRKLMERNTEAAMSELVQLQDLGRAQVTELRAFVRGMQPGDVTPQTVGSAIREAVEHFERDSGISAQLFCGDLSAVSNEVATELLQIVREALNNVRKHSKASRVNLQVEVTPEGVVFIADDDGSGFPFSGTFTLEELEVLRRGPRSIKRRVIVMHGDMSLDSRPSAGSTLRVRLPAG